MRYKMIKIVILFLISISLNLQADTTMLMMVKKNTDISKLVEKYHLSITQKLDDSIYQFSILDDDIKDLSKDSKVLYVHPDHKKIRELR